QAQRIALARALFGLPKLIILDEPNAHLDAQGEASLLEALKATRARGATVLVVAHRTGFMSVADKLMFIRDGRIEHFGPRDQVLARLAAAESGKPGPTLAPVPTVMNTP
ncbi:MAG TPA: type I secretion system permease/ATPase, partial [Caulobacterales bacterium]|nr:type I secretion system permease/ATPase [Caulobacterales bacterium]